MIRCHACGAKNNNHSYCRGCGRSLANQPSPSPIERRQKVNFLNEVVKTIETVYPKETQVEKPLIKQPSVAMTRLVDPSAIFIVDNERCHKVEGIKNYKAMAMDMGVTTTVPLTFSIGSTILLKGSAVMGLKIYFVSYFLVSFLIWFVFPYIFESSPMALIFKNYTFSFKIIYTFLI